MHILFAADIHASPEHLTTLLETARQAHVDAIVVGGDIIPHHLPQTTSDSILDAQSFYLENVLVPALQRFKAQMPAPIFLDMGNDDFISSRPILENHAGDLFNLLHMQRHPLTDRIDIIGYMAVPPTPFPRKDWEKPDTPEQLHAPGNRIDHLGVISKNGKLHQTVLDLTATNTIAADLQRLEALIRRPFLFVSHAPPYDTALDILHDGTHVGSLAIRKFIEKWSGRRQLIASFHGHIHESPQRSGQIEDQVGSARCFNPGQGNGSGAPFEYVIFELDGA